MFNLPNFSSKLLAKAKVLDKNAASRAATFSDPAQNARDKFIIAALEQIDILKCDIAAVQYVSPDIRLHYDKITGETIERCKRLKRWFWKHSSDEWRIQLYYGNKHLIDTVFAFKNPDDVLEFLEGIIKETQNGVLDDAFKLQRGKRHTATVPDKKVPNAKR